MMAFRSMNEIPKADLEELQIGDQMGQDTFMSIDTNSVRDDMIAMVLFLIVVVSTTLAGYFGPSEYISDWNRFSLLSSSTRSIHQSITAIEPINRRVIFLLEFSRRNLKEELVTPVEYTYEAVFKKSGKEVRRLADMKTMNVVFLKDMEDSKTMTFLDDSVIDYDEVNIKVDFLHVSGVSDCMFTWKIGDASFTYFQMWVRFVFSMAIMATSTLMFMRLCPTNISLWSYEQVLTMYLHIAYIIGVNPFYAYFSFHPNPMSEHIEVFCMSLFRSYAAFYILAIVSSTYTEPYKRSACFYIPKVFISSLMFVMSFLPKLENLPDFINLTRIVEAGFMSYFLVISGIALKKTDSIDRHKVIVYISTFLVVIACLFLVSYQEVARFSLEFSSLFGMAIIMAYFHWPYEVTLDQQYDDTESKKYVDFFGDDAPEE